MQYIVSFITGEMAKADFNPLVVQLDDIDRRHLEQTIARAHEILKKLKRKPGGQLTPEESPTELALQHRLSPGNIHIWVTMPQVLQLSSRAANWHAGDIYFSAYARTNRHYRQAVGGDGEGEWDILC